MQPSTVSEKAVGRVIQNMHLKFGEVLTLDDMAHTAMFSKFHFTRMFQRITGISPGRFLTAVRLEKAKYLLRSTSLSVTEITHVVGYSSVGSFSSRFSSCVGLSPRAFRLGGGVPPAARPPRAATNHNLAKVYGEISLAPDVDRAPVFIGLFPDPVPEGIPVAGTTLPGPGSYVLENVPPGPWYVLAHCPSSSGATDGTQITQTARKALDISLFDTGQGICDDTDPVSAVGSFGPIGIGAGEVARVDLELRQTEIFDPPVLLALAFEALTYEQDGPRHCVKRGGAPR
jgi:AraC family transcriptional regulator